MKLMSKLTFSNLIELILIHFSCVNEPAINNLTEYTSASCTDESNNETDDDDDDDDDDENPDHEPTSQLQTPYSNPIPQSNMKQQIHDSAFREYCSQLIDRQLDELCIQLLITLKRFQDRKKQQFQSNPERARRKRRFVHGIREVTKHLRLQRLKCVLLAPDCQSIQSQGGLNDAIEQIINLCKEQNIPYIFTLNRQKLGRCLNKISRISTIGIFDYSGIDDVYKQIIEITNENQHAYKQIINHDDAIPTPSHGLNSRDFYKILHRTFHQQQQQRHHIVNTIPNEKILPKIPAHYAHSRQTSDTSTIYIDPQLIKKQHTRASSGTFDMGKTSTKKNHQRTLSDGAAAIDDSSVQTKHHSRTPSGCSAISQIEQQDYFEQSKHILMINNNNNDEICLDNDENRLKAINEDTEESSANIKRKNVEKWINDN
jgi:ribosomal protein L7Ae-like RNA K-turn-binding protein